MRIRGYCRSRKGPRAKKGGGIIELNFMYSRNNKKSERQYFLVYVHIIQFSLNLHWKLISLLIVLCAYIVKKVFCMWKGSIALSSFVAATKMLIGPPQCNLITLGVSNGWMSKVPDRPTGTDKPALQYTRWLLISQQMEVDLTKAATSKTAWIKGLYCTPGTFSAEP